MEKLGGAEKSQMKSWDIGPLLLQQCCWTRTSSKNGNSAEHDSQQITEEETHGKHNTSTTTKNYLFVGCTEGEDIQAGTPVDSALVRGGSSEETNKIKKPEDDTGVCRHLSIYYAAHNCT